MAAGPMLHFSIEVDLVGRDFGLYLVYTAAVTAVTVLLLFLAARQYSGSRSFAGKKTMPEIPSKKSVEGKEANV